MKFETLIFQKKFRNTGTVLRGTLAENNFSIDKTPRKQQLVIQNLQPRSEKREIRSHPAKDKDN